MWARMTFVKIKPDSVDEFRKVYDAAMVPTVTAQKGNAGIYLLEPEDVSEEFVSVTAWDDKESGEAYEAAGKHAALTEKVKDLIAAPPTVRSYYVRD